MSLSLFDFPAEVREMLINECMQEARDAAMTEGRALTDAEALREAYVVLLDPEHPSDAAFIESGYSF